MSASLQLAAAAVREKRKRQTQKTSNPVPHLSLREFVWYSWHVVEPSTPLIWNWHIDAICEHLEAVTAGQIQNLLINIPPGHMKSLIVSVFWPAWEWIENPALRSLFSSYGMQLALRDSVRCRDLVTSDWYQVRFSPAWRVRHDLSSKTHFENDQTGWRYSLSVGGPGTGFRGNKIIADDPLNAKETYSKIARDECVFWWDKVMSSRLNDMRSGAKVIIMQRLHEEDLSGHVLNLGGYDHLCLPSEFDSQRRVYTSIGWTDPRTEDKELLFPELFTAEVLAEAKKNLGPIDYAGQHGQLPAPMEGAMFQPQWFKIEDAAPARLVDAARYWDKANALPGKGDLTIGVLMGKDAKNEYWIIDVVRLQVESDERNAAILQTAQIDARRGFHVKTWVEREPGAGKESTAIIIKMLAGFNAQEDPVTKNKAERAEGFAAQARAGNVHLVKAAWNKDFLAVLSVFPNGAHDDDVDAGSGAFNKLALANALQGPALVGGQRPTVAAVR